MAKKLTAKQVAAEILPFHYRHILKMAKAKKIPAKQVGSSWLFDKDELDAWWKQRDDEPRNHSRRSEERTA